MARHRGGTAFGAPPPTLLLYVPFAFLPSTGDAFVWLGIDLLAVAFVIRRLHLPWWWVLFPPLAQAIVPANPEPVVVACLVAAGPVANALAPLVKIYAFAPLIGERRWHPSSYASPSCDLRRDPARGLFIRDLPVVTDTLVAQRRESWFAAVADVRAGLRRSGSPPGRRSAAPVAGAFPSSRRLTLRLLAASRLCRAQPELAVASRRSSRVAGSHCPARRPRQLGRRASDRAGPLAPFAACSSHRYDAIAPLTDADGERERPPHQTKRKCTGRARS